MASKSEIEKAEIETAKENRFLRNFFGACIGLVGTLYIGVRTGAENTLDALKEPICRAAFQDAQNKGTYGPDVQIKSVTELSGTGLLLNPPYKCTIEATNGQTLVLTVPTIAP